MLGMSVIYVSGVISACEPKFYSKHQNENRMLLCLVSNTFGILEYLEHRFKVGF